VRHASWRRYAAPAAFLLAVTVAVLLVRSGLHAGTGATGSTSTGTPPTTPAAVTTTTKKPPRHTTTTKSGRRYWTVRAGDTFGVISAQSGVSVAQLTRLNPKVSSTSLFIGEKIRIK
jgi:LysM repeat protein